MGRRLKTMKLARERVVTHDSDYYLIIFPVAIVSMILLSAAGVPAWAMLIGGYYAFWGWMYYMTVNGMLNNPWEEYLISMAVIIPTLTAMTVWLIYFLVDLVMAMGVAA